MRSIMPICFAVLAAGSTVRASCDETRPTGELPRNLRVVLENTNALSSPRNGRLPLFILPISNALANCDNDQAERVLRDLDRRGIGYTVDWDPAVFEKSLAEGLRIGTLQKRLGLRVAINANACLYSFFDGSSETLHADDSGQEFAETSFGGRLGCPFTLEHRYPVMKERVEKFLRQYKQAGIDINFIFADWEIDGPIEWNDAWSSSRRCRRCRQHISQIDDFRHFQKSLRQIRSEMQRVAFGDNVTNYFPQALVGNYAVYPHGGHRYWYDYFEREAAGVPFLADQGARYREWFHEFRATGYTVAMPVVYTWYPTFSWYHFDDLDYRWFYNLLLVGSNAGRHTAQTTPVISFVHWTTTAPPKNPDRSVQQFSETNYKELLWHLLLRGHDTFFLWCMPDELAKETRLVHDVYSKALAYEGFLNRGTPVSFEVPKRAGPVVSGLRLQDRVLVRRTDFGEGSNKYVTLELADGKRVVVPPHEGAQVLSVQPNSSRIGLLQADGRPRFPIGFYELPKEDDELKAMAGAGVNLIHCGSRDDLDRAHAAGLLGWVSVGVQQGRTDALRGQIESVADHPALAVWEGPDEIVWTFTAYSALEKTAGFTRDDWNRQTPKAVAYSEEKAAQIIPNMREGIRLVRELDRRNLPIWINEAADSDTRFVREYVDAIDITGCDYYAVRSTGTDLQSVGRLVDRWHAIGRGKPVWMVLQAFSWHTARPERERLYPSFAQSRFMAYDAIAHGARGILYWGSNTIDDPAFRQSLYALTAEIAEIEPFLLRRRHDMVRAELIDDLFDPPGLGVHAALFSHDSEYLLLLVNEDAHRHLGVDITGIDVLDGRRLQLLYGSEVVEVTGGGFVTRLQGYEIKVFATNPRFASSRQDGRSYGQASPNK